MYVNTISKVFLQDSHDAPNKQRSILVAVRYTVNTHTHTSVNESSSIKC